MTIIRQSTARTLLTIAAAIALLAPAAAQDDDAGGTHPYFRHWPQPMVLVELSPTSGQGVVTWRLVPGDFARTAPDGMQAKQIGGPYRSRSGVELDRNRLAREGHNATLTSIDVYQTHEGGGSGEIALEKRHKFLLGSKPVLAYPGLSLSEGNLDASFEPASPDFFPLPFELDHYLDYASDLLEQAELRRLEEAAANEDAKGGPLSGAFAEQMTAIDANASIAADVTCPPLIAQIFGQDSGGEVWTFSNTVPVGFSRSQDGAVEISFDSGGQTVIVPGRSDANGMVVARLATEAGVFSIGGIVFEGPNRLHGKGRALFAFEGERCDIDWSVPG